MLAGGRTDLPRGSGEHFEDMGLAQFSIKKPVTTMMIFAGVILFGVISLVKLPQELFPPITYPQLTVFTGYANAAPEEIETLLTKPIEEAVGTVSGLKSVRSISKEGTSLVMGEFDWDQNMDFASLRTREKVDLIKARLPRDASEPLVVPFNPFEMPVMTISVTGNRNPAQLRKITVDIIKEELEKINGVASASVEGGLEREILVEVSQPQLKGYGVSITDVSDAITNANLNYPAGTIKESFYEYLIRTLGEFRDIYEIEKVVVKNLGEETKRSVSFDEELASRDISDRSKMVLVKDVANVVDTFKERSSYSRLNNKENISVSIQKQAQANTTQVISRIKESLPKFRKILPDDIKLEIVYDQSVFIKDAINGVRDAAWQGGVLAFLVLLFFLKNAKSSFIVTLSIPISVMVVFTFMYFGGVTLNMMSLGGLALGVGMLVDNAIVVIENIFRHRENGEGPEDAAAGGAEEVLNAVTASTLTTIAVFLPMIFVIGIAGQLFKELAFTITWSLLGSLWVAMTLIPLLSCKLGGSEKEAAQGAEAFAGGESWHKFLAKFRGLLERFLEKKGRGLVVVFAIFIVTLWMAGSLEKELMPKTDQGEFVIDIDLPVGTKLSETNQLSEKVEKEILKSPYIKTVSSIVGSTKGESAKDIAKRLGSNQAQIIVALKDRRKITTRELVQEFEKDFRDDKTLQGAKISFQMNQGVISGAFGEGGKPVTIEVKGDKLDVIERIVRDVERELRKIPGIFGIEDDVPEPSPEIRMSVDKEKTALFNISVVDLARVAQMVLRGYIPSQFKEKGHEIDIRVRMQEQDRDSYGQLYRIRVSNPGGGSVPLGSLVKFERGRGPSEIKRLGQERTMVVSADVVGRKVSDVMEDVEKIIKKMKVESGYIVRVAGQSEEMKKSFQSLQFALILSIVLVYMIMAAQFESISQPLIILCTLPLALIGVIWALMITGTSLNVVALLGLIMLGGVVVNNGIVLIDFINILMRNGQPMREAVINASLARLRPILMSSLTTVLGLIPMALATGRGSELRAPMAITVMGGLTLSTFLTLFVLPAIFIYENEIRTGIVSMILKKRKNNQD